MEITVSAEVVRQAHGRASFTGVFFDDDVSDLLDGLPIRRGGFGSIKVDATVGRTVWRTSVFPTSEGFLLLIARKVLLAEELEVGEVITVGLRILAL